IAVSLLGSDVDGTVATFVIKTLPDNGVLKYGGSPVTVGQEIPASGNAATLTFYPNANWSGETDFNYASQDDDGLDDPSPALATISITPVNDPPDAKDDAGTTPEDVPVTFTVGTLLGNDTDPENDALTVTSVQAPVNGTVSLVGGVV